MVESRAKRVVAAVALGLAVAAVACTVAQDAPAAAPTAPSPVSTPVGGPPAAPATPPPTPTAEAPSPAGPGADPVPSDTPFVPPAPTVAWLRPVAPDGWEAPLIVSSSPGARASAPLDVDGPIFISWTIVNVGDVPAATGFSVDLLLDGVPVERWGVGGLGVGDSQSVVDWDELAVRARLSPGHHTLSLHVDPTGLVQPGTAVRSRYSVVVEVPESLVPREERDLAPERRPNLAVHVPEGWDGPILVTPGAQDALGPGAPRGIGVRISFQNSGLSSVSDFFQVYLYLDGVMVARFGQRGIAAQGVVVTPPWTGLPETMRLAPGAHVLELSLDPTGLVTETTRDDNIFSVGFVWSPWGALVLPAQGVAASDGPVTGTRIVSYAPSGWTGPLVAAVGPGRTGAAGPLYSEDPLYVSWSVRNGGGTDLDGPLPVELVLDGLVVAVWDRPGLAAGHIDFVVDWPVGTAPSPGLHRIALQVREPGGADGPGAVRVLAERSYVWLDGSAAVPPPAELAPEEVRRRLAKLEGLRSMSAPTLGRGTSGVVASVLDVADVVYSALHGRSLRDEPLAIHIVTRAEYAGWVEAECQDVASGLTGDARAVYLGGCASAKRFAGYQSQWRGLHRIVIQGERPPMEVLGTLAHELGHFVQSQINPGLDALTDLDSRALREAQAYAHQTLFLRTLQGLTGLDLMLYPQIDGFGRFIPDQVDALVKSKDVDEHARGKLLLWLSLLTDPELRGQRTVLFNSLVLSTDAAHQLFDYLAAVPAAEVRIYATVRFRTLSAQVEAIKSIALARLVPGLPYWNEGHPFFREVGLLLP